MALALFVVELADQTRGAARGEDVRASRGQDAIETGCAAGDLRDLTMLNAPRAALAREVF